MDDLGELGFWLAAGMALAAWIMSAALKEREKERQKQETLREMMRLEAEGKLTPETLRYMREKDEAERLAAEQQIAREKKEGDRVGAGILAFIVGGLSFLGGVAAFGAVGERTESWQIAVPVMLGIWAAGALLAFLIFRALRGPKKAQPPGA